MNIGRVLPWFPREAANGCRARWLFLGLLLGLGWQGATGREATGAAGEFPTLRGDRPTALDRYVAAPDTNFSFRVVDVMRQPGGAVHRLEMTSQVWLTTNEVDRPLWRHWLSMAIPQGVTNQTALLFITGGSHDKGPPKGMDGMLTRIALETHSVVAELRDVPNQPLVFHQDGHPRSEDDLIAYTWDQYLRTGDDRWPARLPMTKSAVRAMDAVSRYGASSPDGDAVKVDRFVVAGASKRGWTTWMTAAVDPRVVAIVPIVIDVLNVEPSMRHHFAAYGFWAPAVGDYTEFHIMDWVGSAPFARLMRIVDPYQYRQRFTMPKLILNDTGDQFFLPDSSQFYFDDLPQPKYLRYVPNTDHSLKGSDAPETLATFYESILTGQPLPRFTWKFEKDGAIRVAATDRPVRAALWQATNPDARDFRLETIGPAWTNTPLTLQDGVGVARVGAPPKGWTAFMVELTFAGPGGKPLKLTTPVRVLPDKTNYKFVPQAPAGATR